MHSHPDWPRCEWYNMSANLQVTNLSRSWMTYFFRRKFDLPEGELGTIFFFTSIIAAASMLVASSIAKRIGNIKVRDTEF